MITQLIRLLGYVVSLVVAIVLFGQIVAGLVLGTAFTIVVLLWVLPPSRAFFRPRLGWIPNRNQTIALLAIWFFITGAVLHNASEREMAAEKAASALIRKQAKDSKWASERKAIIARVESEVQAKRYESAVSIASEWTEYGDADLIRLQNKSKEALLEMQRRTEIDSLTKALEDSAGKSIEEIYDIYKRLNELVPNQEQYKSAVAELGPHVEKIRKDRELTRLEEVGKAAAAEKERREMEATEEFLESAMYACKKEVVKSAKWEGAEADWTPNAKAVVTAPNVIRVIGRDVKLANAFGAKRYVVYECFYNTKTTQALVMSVN